MCPGRSARRRVIASMPPPKIWYSLASCRGSNLRPCTESSSSRSNCSAITLLCAAFNSRRTAAESRIACCESRDPWMTSLILAGTPISMAISTCGSSIPSPATPIRRMASLISHLAADGTAPAFQIAGDVHVDGGSYLGAGMNATGVNLDAHIDADRGKLLITQIVARMRQGGQIEGSVSLAPWLPGAQFVPAQITARIGTQGSEESRRARNVLVRPAASSHPDERQGHSQFQGRFTRHDSRYGLPAAVPPPRFCRSREWPGKRNLVERRRAHHRRLFNFCPQPLAAGARRRGARDRGRSMPPIRSAMAEWTCATWSCTCPRAISSREDRWAPIRSRARRRLPSIFIRMTCRSSTPCCAAWDWSAMAGPGPQLCLRSLRGKPIFTEPGPAP